MDCEFTNFLTKRDRRLEGIRVRCVTLDTAAKNITVDIAYLNPLPLDVQERLKQLCEEFIGQEGWNLLIYAEKSRFTPAILQDFIWQEIEAKPSIASQLDRNCIKSEGNCVEIACDERVFNHFNSINFEQTLAELLNKNFCDTFTVSISKTNSVDLDELAKTLQSDFVIPTDDDENRRIKVREVARLIGELFGDEAMYIKDITYEREVVLCGRISGLKKLVAKRTGNPFFVFVLTDPTGSMEVTHFVSKANLKKAEQLANGDQVIIKGKAGQDDRFVPNTPDQSAKVKFKTIANSIAYCSLPKTFHEVVFKKPVPTSYRFIYPKPYVSGTIQLTFGNLLSPKEEVVPSYFLGKTFVVFDLETTGTDRQFDKVTEIGAIKIVDGVPTEVFETLIDPEVLISQDVTKLTGIENTMVAGKPKIDEVIADFHKFCDGAILVAHNAGFDIAFVSRFGTENGFYFEHEIVDTLELSRQVLPQNKYHNLAFLSDYFGVVNKGAHRAVNDCEALMDIFIELVKLRDKNT